jgi:Contractile injection system tube protein
MPSDFPRSPKVQKGALAVYASQSAGTQPDIIAFQYNPDQLSRTLAARAAPREPGNAGAAREDMLRVVGPPVENINLSVVMDAADQLQVPASNQPVVENGLHPVLAKLELLLYQPEAAMREAGQAPVYRTDLPLTLLYWGKSRAVPVLLTSFSVTEEAFDPSLNPIRARVELGMRVLTDVELQESGVGTIAYLAYRSQKNNLAGLYQAGDVSGAIRGQLPA